MTASNRMGRPAFPYGAQYYRTPNPQPSEWAKDFATMEASGFTVVKHWALWTWLHLGPDSFDWSTLDELMDLGRRHKITAIINVVLETAPYWLWHEHPEYRREANTGLKADLTDEPAHPSGGWPGLCFDQPIVQEQSGHFLTALASRYRDHPALLSFDAWNEPVLSAGNYDQSTGPTFCYCSATRDKFVRWLKQRYSTLEPRWARVIASYEDGTAAATEDAYGGGVARLAGTSLGISYMENPGPAAAVARLMCDLALGPRAEPQINVDAPRIMARFLRAAQEDGGGGLLYVVNPTFRPVETHITVSPQMGAFRRAMDMVADTAREWRGGGVSLSLGARDGTVLRLMP